MRWSLLVALAACQNPSKLDGVAPMASTSAAPTAPLVVDAAAIDAWVDATVKQRGIVGASLVIVRDGTPVLAKGYGTRAIGTAQPIDADTPFALGSISKQIACALVYGLVDWLLGAADVWASANDLAAWNLALVDGTLISPASLRAMSTARTLRDGRTTSYGCGVFTRIVNGEHVLVHGGWVGGFHTFNAIVPRTRSAVVLLTNDEHADLVDVHERLVRLVTEDAAAVPVIAGPPAAEAARTLIVQLQHGTLDRATLGADLAAYFDEARVAAARASLAALGEPTVTLVSRRERGGLEHAALRVAFASSTIEASMFRSPDGKIRQLLLTP